MTPFFTLILYYIINSAFVNMEFNIKSSKFKQFKSLNIPRKGGQYKERMYKRTRLPLVIPPPVSYWLSGGVFLESKLFAAGFFSRWERTRRRNIFSVPVGVFQHFFHILPHINKAIVFAQSHHRNTLR